MCWEVVQSGEITIPQSAILMVWALAGRPPRFAEHGGEETDGMSSKHCIILVVYRLLREVRFLDSRRIEKHSRIPEVAEVTMIMRVPGRCSTCVLLKNHWFPYAGKLWKVVR
eukprot:gene13848-biopygen1467